MSHEMVSQASLNGAPSETRQGRGGVRSEAAVIAEAQDRVRSINLLVASGPTSHRNADSFAVLTANFGPDEMRRQVVLPPRLSTPRARAVHAK